MTKFINNQHHFYTIAASVPFELLEKWSMTLKNIFRVISRSWNFQEKNLGLSRIFQEAREPCHHNTGLHIINIGLQQKCITFPKTWYTKNECHFEGLKERFWQQYTKVPNNP